MKNNIICRPFLGKGISLVTFCGGVFIANRRESGKACKKTASEIWNVHENTTNFILEISDEVKVVVKR